MSEADTKRCATETTLRDTTSNAYTCRVDRQPCEVMGPLRDRLDSETYSEVAKDLIDGLPCKDCRAGAADARRLSEASVRLGKHERRILLEAPPTSKCGWRGSLQQPTYRFSGLIVWPEGPGRSAEEAHRRALRKLVAAGLIATENTSATFLDDEAAEMPKWAKAERARSRYWMWGRKRQAVKLTPLGERVVETYRDELEAGRPIRWAKHIGALEAAAHRPPGELLDLLDRGAIGSALFSADFVTALARDPARKEQAARKIAALKKAQEVVREMAANTDTTVGGG